MECEVQTKSFTLRDNKIIMRVRDRIVEDVEELCQSEPFHAMLTHFLRQLERRESRLLAALGTASLSEELIECFAETLRYLTKLEAEQVPHIVPDSAPFFANIDLLSELVEEFYNYWRSYDRFVICDSQGDRLDKRPYRTFNATIESLTHLVRQAYRDIAENITHKHPNVYRQVHAGAEVATIALPMSLPFFTGRYAGLQQVRIIRQILIYPPLIFDPPMNKRRGMFTEVDRNPLEAVEIDPDHWLCFPAKVGELLILVYFHEKFYEVGFGLSNLYELAEEADLQRKPDAVYFYGVEGRRLYDFAELPTVYYRDTERDVLVGAVPGDDEFGYFGYLKKMMLTLHNIKMMQKERMPFHGAYVRIALQQHDPVTVLMIGDSGAGKSESLEALRCLDAANLQDLLVIADDMGSIGVSADGKLLGYGTEIGAFLRLDDLQPGYAFNQMDRAIIMNPNRTNARIVLPITSYETIIRGFPIDIVLYANNYEDIDEDHPVLERFETVEKALDVFREGTVMSKGTTARTGLVHSYFANIFGPPQNRKLHDRIARQYFERLFEQQIFVGQIRTRLGVPGYETEGPRASAQALIGLLAEGWR